MRENTLFVETFYRELFCMQLLQVLKEISLCFYLGTDKELSRNNLCR